MEALLINGQEGTWPLDRKASPDVTAPVAAANRLIEQHTASERYTLASTAICIYQQKIAGLVD